MFYVILTYMDLKSLSKYNNALSFTLILSAKIVELQGLISWTYTGLKAVIRPTTTFCLCNNYNYRKRWKITRTFFPTDRRPRVIVQCALYYAYGDKLASMTKLACVHSPVTSQGYCQMGDAIIMEATTHSHTPLSQLAATR